MPEQAGAVPAPPRAADPRWDVKSHFESLKDAYKELIDANQKILGILLIVFGWFVSQANPLRMICNEPWIAPVAIIFTIFGLMFLAYLFNRIFLRADLSRRALIDSGVDSRLIEGYCIKRSMYWIGLFGQFTLLFGICWVIESTYIEGRDKTCKDGTHSTFGAFGASGR